MAILNAFASPGIGRSPRGRRRAWLAVLLLAVLAGSEIRAQAAPSREYQIKAVFLFNFAQFVEWPPAAFRDEQSPLIIGVLGEDPFGDFLDETVRGEKISERPLIVRRYRHIEDLDNCHILFISRSEAGQLDQIVARLKNRPILTVSDSEDSARRGVMIRFLNENNRIRLRINLASARLAGLTISSKLLRPAEIIAEGRD